MKTKKLMITAFCVAVFHGQACVAVTINCTNCTLDGTATGTCYIYDTTCCEVKCRSEGGGEIVKPTTCDEISCPALTKQDLNNGCTKLVAGTCLNGSCKKVTSYKCSVGYYGTATVDRFDLTGQNCTGCTICPTQDGIVGTTSDVGAASVTECYIPSGTKGTDSTGSFTYTGNSYYCN